MGRAGGLTPCPLPGTGRAVSGSEETGRVVPNVVPRSLWMAAGGHRHFRPASGTWRGPGPGPGVSRSECLRVIGNLTPLFPEGPGWAGLTRGCGRGGERQPGAALLACRGREDPRHLAAGKSAGAGPGPRAWGTALES